MHLTEINTASPFKDLFPINNGIVRELVKDMKENGFDESKPLVLWAGHKSILLDGHSRLMAARIARVMDVPVVYKEFRDEERALEYTINCQKNRRNLTDKEILSCIAALDKKKPSGQRSDLAQHCARSGKSSAETASLLGISQRKVEQVRTVMDKAPEEIKEAVKSGEMSINAAYNKTVNPQKGTPESIQLAAEEIEKIDKVFEIIKERLNQNQIRELIKRLVKEITQ